MRWVQGLELLVTVLLARSRQPPTVAAGVPHADFAAELMTLPSGLLAMVCEAIVKLKVRRGGCMCMRGPSEVGVCRGADEVPAHCAAPARVGYGAVLTHLRGLVPPWRSAGSTASSAVSTLQVSDVATTRRNSQRTGPLRRSSRLSTLRARASA